MANASSLSSGNWAGGDRKEMIPNVTLHAWPIQKLNESLKQINDTNYLVDKNSESAKNYTFSLHNLNATGYVANDDDLIDTGLTDVQTFILAGIATVIPLLVIVITILGVKYLWRRYGTKKEEEYGGVLQKEESSEPLGKLQTYSLLQELKYSESQFTVTQEDPSSTPSTQLPTPKSNGSVITMTLKNNHLIVETEETTNTPEGTKMESKGTTTKFVTSKAPDFCFENHFQILTCFSKELSELQLANGEENCNADLSSTNHGALVHNIPAEIEDDLEKGSCNTGLSQSDLSVSSTESQNPSYCYGNQTGYDCGCYGYSEYTGCILRNSASKQSNLSQTGPRSHDIASKWASVEEGADSYQTDGQTEGQSFKDILMSDIQAREKRVQDTRTREQSAHENGNPVVCNKTETSLPNSHCFEKMTTPESQPTHFKSEKFQLAGNHCLSNDGINGKETEGS